MSGSRGSSSPERADLSGLLPWLGSLLPAELVPLFDEPFVRSCLIYEEYVHRLTLEVFDRSGLAGAARTAGTAGELMARAQMDPAQARIPVLWMLRDLATRGVLDRIEPANPASSARPAGVSKAGSTSLREAPGEGAGAVPKRGVPEDDSTGVSLASGLDAELSTRYQVRSPLPDLDPDEMLEAQRAIDDSWLPAYTVARIAATDYPDFLAGRITGEEILFSPSRLGLWFEYFTNQNGLYRVNNRIGAIAAEMWLPGENAAVLELGGGLGSAAEAFLERFRDRGRLADLKSYRFTELVPAFLRRATRSLTEKFADAGLLSFGRLDMDKPFAAQGIEPGSASLVYAVNTLHVAKDLAYTLGEIRAALAPGGRLVLSECVKPSAADTTYVEFIFNLMETFRSPKLDPRTRPAGGFLTPEQWTVALAAAGFRDVRFLPDIQRIQKDIAVFYVAAVGATRSD